MGELEVSFEASRWLSALREVEVGGRFGRQGSWRSVACLMPFLRIGMMAMG